MSSGPHDMSWRHFQHKARMRFGLRWRKSYPTLGDYAEALAYWICAIGIIASLLLIWSVLDARDAQIAAQLEASESSRQFADFLNGGVLTNPEQTFAVKCERLMEVTK